MTGTSTHRAEHRRSLKFLLWGWAMLLVVLLSAAPTVTQPRTRFVGSAFDPATFSVVLNPKQPRLASSSASLDKRKTSDDVGDLAPALPTSETFLLPETGPASAPPAVAIDTGSFPHAPAFSGAAGPRAPPA